jgi:hypothetical protein
MKSQNWGPIIIIQGEIKFESFCLTFYFILREDTFEEFSLKPFLKAHLRDVLA